MGMRKLLLILFLLPVFASAQSPMFKLIAKKSGCNPDSDAQKFIDSLSLTGTEATAICNLVKDLKDSSLWSSMQAIYPMIGGTASTQKWNLKDVRNVDAAFRLVFTGGWTHSSTGALPNGSTGYANTFYQPSTNATAGSNHMSYYSRTTGGAAETMIEMGSQGTAFRENQIIIRFSNAVYLESNSVAGGYVTAANTNAQGYYIATRTSNTAIGGQKNTTQYTGTATESLSNYVTYLGARNRSGTAEYFSNRECAFATIGTGLSAAQMLTLNIIVERYNDALGRGIQ